MGVVSTVKTLAGQVEPVGKLGVRRMLGVKSPFQVTFSLTNRCNFHCEYCDIPIQRREEMSAADFCEAIDALREAGMGRASLIGGEPLLRKDAGEIIAHLKRRGVHSAMNTNGWYVPERIDEVAELDLVCVTLDGPPEVHDAQRKKGSYARAIEALEILRSRGVPIVTMTVITPAGAESVEHVLEVARGLGCKAFFQLEHDKSCDVNAPIAIRLGAKAIEGVAQKLLRLKNEGAPVGNSREILDAQIRGGRYLGSCEDCYAGRYYAYVLSDGTIAPCLLTQWQQEAGNGRKLGFARAFEAMRPPEGPGCSCVPTHEVNRVLGLDVAALWHAIELALPAPLR
ncbi:MAG: radical SAM protein [Sandaracinaceae bacterium]|nr:radical SAM protein [Sandaracinaceae bacterium]